MSADNRPEKGEKMTKIKTTGIREKEVANVYNIDIDIKKQGNKGWTIDVSADCTSVSNVSSGAWDIIISEFVSNGEMDVNEVINLDITAKSDRLNIWAEKMESDIRTMTTYVANGVRSVQHMTTMKLKDIIRAKMFEGENDVPGCIIAIDGLTLCPNIDYYEDWTDFNHFELIKRD